MNTRFSYNLLQAFTKKCNGNSGFSLVLVTIAGMIALVAGAAMIIKGTNDQNQVISQKAKMVANSAAEAGMARLQQTLLANPDLATVPLSKWQEVLAAYDSNPDSVILIQDMGGISGNNVNSINELVSDVKQNSCTYAALNDANAKTQLMSAIRSMVQTSSTAETLPNPSGNAGMQAKFRLRNYVYYPNGTAKVQVEGIAGSDTTGAKTQLVGTFPVATGMETIPTDIFPGLWVKERLQIGQNDNVPGRLEANVAYDCGIQAGALSTSAGNGQTAGYTQYLSAATVGTRKAISVALPAGSPPPKETNIPMPDPPTSAPTGVTPVDLGNISSRTTLPRSTDTTSSANYHAATQTYYYSAGDITLGSTNSLVFTPGKKVVLLLRGNISMSGSGAIAHNMSNCPSGSSCDATDMRILGIGSSTNTTRTFSTTGNASVCSIFFWAPTYSVDMSGGGNAGDCPTNANQNGIYWVKAWIGGGQGNHTALVQNSSNWSKIFGLPYDILLKNQLGSVSGWAMMDEDGAVAAMPSATSSSSTSSTTSSTSPSSSSSTSSTTSSSSSTSSTSSSASAPTNRTDCRARGGSWSNQRNTCTNYI